MNRGNQSEVVENRRAQIAREAPHAVQRLLRHLAQCVGSRRLPARALGYAELIQPLAERDQQLHRFVVELPRDPLPFTFLRQRHLMGVQAQALLAFTLKRDVAQHRLRGDLVRFVLHDRPRGVHDLRSCRPAVHHNLLPARPRIAVVFSVAAVEDVQQWLGCL